MSSQDTASVLGAGAVAAGAATGAITPAGWLMAGSQILSGALSKPAVPNNSSAFSETTVNSFMDSSGWTVATGQGKADGAQISKGLGSDVASAAQGLAWPLVALALLAGIYIWKRA